VQTCLAKSDTPVEAPIIRPSLPAVATSHWNQESEKNLAKSTHFRFAEGPFGMARNLNKKRIQYSWASIPLVILVIIFTKPLFAYNVAFHEGIEFAGYFLVAFCVLGRVYTAAFLGGFKNQKLVSYGPFSIVRNPFYFFSLIGILGLSLSSGHLLVIALLFPFFTVMYHFLIRREEEFLLTTFGQDYKEYMAKTPRLIPKLSLYNCPDQITVRPKFITNACLDAIWWFVAFPAFELIEYFQESGAIPVLVEF
jgi:protein-S-isoprenylcysteine O-methyltransferase Ste14